MTTPTAREFAAIPEFAAMVANPENLDVDGTVKWNFVEADCYTEIAGFGLNPKDFFDDVVTFYILEFSPV